MRRLRDIVGVCRDHPNQHRADADGDGDGDGEELLGSLDPTGQAGFSVLEAHAVPVYLRQETGAAKWVSSQAVDPNPGGRPLFYAAVLSAVATSRVAREAASSVFGKEADPARHMFLRCPAAERRRSGVHRVRKAIPGGVHADAIMDRIVHNTVSVETGTCNMREHTALTNA